MGSPGLSMRVALMIILTVLVLPARTVCTHDADVRK